METRWGAQGRAGTCSHIRLSTPSGAHARAGAARGGGGEGPDQSANGSLRAIRVQTAELKIRPETVDVLPFHFPTTRRAGSELRTLGSLGCCTGTR